MKLYPIVTLVCISNLRPHPFLQQITASSIHREHSNMDRISYLPQSILHDIMSRLPEKDADRISVLSKSWYDTWSTFPFLVFDESRYETTKIPEDASVELKAHALLLDKYKFCLAVLCSLLNFESEGLGIRKFKLVFKRYTPRKVLSHINRWMELVCYSGVEVLQLDKGVEEPQHDNPSSSYSIEEFSCLPPCVLEAKSLIKLELSWNFRVDQAFLNHPIKFCSLQLLSLKHVYLGDGQVIQNLISSCPLIENIELVFCYGLKSVSIHSLPKLMRVFIVGIEEVDVDAPSLEFLFYDVSGFKTIIPGKIDMDKCKNLRELCLVQMTSIIITDQWFLELFRTFPLLEMLTLEAFYMFDMIYISSVQLKVLDLCNCYDSDDIEIDAPNLKKFKYHDDNSVFPIISILNSSSQFVLEVEIYADFLLDLVKLRDFLENVEPKQIPISLFIGFDDESTVEFDPFELQLVSPPSIKHLHLCAASDKEECCLLFVTSVFWSCRPSIVSLNVDSSKTLVKIFCEKLIGRKDDSCCSSSEIKCWWHFLKDLKVSSSFRKCNAADDFKSLLEAFPTLSLEEEDKISRFSEGDIQFTFEWQL
ncbi:hypothetical protein RIF29_28959 [Crotalaria pallida]|uniref:F-box domain-containing protein n=1 Tax=Crotalaria pallida TaxID=3830 RepID=A0AAN9EDW4_CROPI